MKLDIYITQIRLASKSRAAVSILKLLSGAQGKNYALMIFISKSSVSSLVESIVNTFSLHATQDEEKFGIWQCSCPARRLLFPYRMASN